jgi:hypothetical protein
VHGQPGKPGEQAHGQPGKPGEPVHGQPGKPSGQSPAPASVNKVFRPPTPASKPAPAPSQKQVQAPQQKTKNSKPSN